MIVIDATNQVLGRLCSEVAKRLLKGEKVIVINAEKSIISGDPKVVIERYREKRQRGNPHHGPYYPRTPAGILKRCVRGMLPRKKPKGREALKRLRVYAGNPENLEGIKVAKTKEELLCKYITLEDLCKQI